MNYVIGIEHTLQTGHVLLTVRIYYSLHHYLAAVDRERLTRIKNIVRLTFVQLQS